MEIQALHFRGTFHLIFLKRSENVTFECLKTHIFYMLYLNAFGYVNVQFRFENFISEHFLNLQKKCFLMC